MSINKIISNETQVSLKSLILMAIIMIVATSYSFGQAKIETIKGLRYLLETTNKSATVMPSNSEKYSGIINVPEKVKASDDVEYTVTSLGDNAFNGCESLASITIPSTVTSLGENCFRLCSSLRSITIPPSVTSLRDNCFFWCASLKNISIPSSVTSIGYSCFACCKSLKSIALPSSVTSLGEACFIDCDSLIDVTISSSVTSLERACFSHCYSLTNIIIPSSVTSLGDECFSNCTSLKNITIPSSVTSFGAYCFQECSSLSSITIPSSVLIIASSCFQDCLKLEQATFKGSVPSIHGSCGIPTSCIIYVPKEYLQDYKSVLGEKYPYIYASKDEEEENPTGKCETPTIAYSDGKLRFVSSTPNAEYHYSLTTMDTASDVYTKEGIINLSAAYDIKAYATADGYMASDVATATLYWLEKSEDNPSSNIIQAKTRGIVATGQDGIVRISGLDDGEEVGFYTTDGKLIATAKAIGGVVSQALNEYNDYIVIAKIAGQSIKIATR